MVSRRRIRGNLNHRKFRSYSLPPIGDSAVHLVSTSRLQAIAANGAFNEDGYDKIGDSNSAFAGFMVNFQSGNNQGVYALGSFAGLEPTLRRFLFYHLWQGPACVSGTRTGYALGIEDAGGLPIDPPTNPNPLAQHFVSLPARYAFIMYGSNQEPLASFETNLRAIVAQCITAGVIPILNTIPFCFPCAMNPNTPFNDIVKAIASDTDLPWLDVRSMTDTLPNLGTDVDGIHFSTAGELGACDLRTGMAGGFNMRNMLTLKMLRLIRAARFGVAPE